ncbi:MAG: molybdopterin-dependent oxidoreductase [Candidatus Bathyarchaeia archaeon]
MIVTSVGTAIWIYSFSAATPWEVFENSERWVLVDGFVQRPLNLTLNKLKAMSKTTVYAELICVGSPTKIIAKGNWTGVRLGFILEQAGIKPEAIKVFFYAKDGYTTDLDIKTAMREDVIIAYERDGVPLPEQTCLIVPGKWGYKWIREITHIELVNYNALGTWESSGFSDTAEISEES